MALGSLLETNNQWQQAEDCYRNALEIQPSYAAAANNPAYLMLDTAAMYTPRSRWPERRGGVCQTRQVPPTLLAGPITILASPNPQSTYFEKRFRRILRMLGTITTSGRHARRPKNPEARAPDYNRENAGNFLLREAVLLPVLFVF